MLTTLGALYSNFSPIVDQPAVWNQNVHAPLLLCMGIGSLSNLYILNRDLYRVYILTAQRERHYSYYKISKSDGICRNLQVRSRLMEFDGYVMMRKKNQIQLQYLINIYPATCVPCGILHLVSKTLLYPNQIRS